MGLGTGIAPFRAFIQQRAAWRDQGKNVGPMLLYFGARYEATEYLFGDEIEQYHKDGVLTHLKKAFSRDQEEKIYAQHRIAEDPHLLYTTWCARTATSTCVDRPGACPRR